MCENCPEIEGQKKVFKTAENNKTYDKPMNRKIKISPKRIS